MEGIEISLKDRKARLSHRIWMAFIISVIALFILMSGGVLIWHYWTF